MKQFWRFYHIDLSCVADGFDHTIGMYLFRDYALDINLYRDNALFRLNMQLLPLPHFYMGAFHWTVFVGLSHRNGLRVWGH